MSAFTTMHLTKRTVSLRRTVLCRQHYASQQARHLHPTLPAGAAGKDPRLSQGHAADASNNQHPQDPHSQAARRGQQQAGADAPLDAAARAPQLKGQSDGGVERSAPNAGVGMVEQVGGASAGAENFGKGGKKGKEEPAAGDSV
ncbi:hypothetical protein HDZ31DRAFT_64609 [Schizophyllum fasciatum]